MRHEAHSTSFIGFCRRRECRQHPDYGKTLPFGENPIRPVNCYLPSMAPKVCQMEDGSALILNPNAIVCQNMDLQDCSEIDDLVGRSSSSDAVRSNQ